MNNYILALDGEAIQIKNPSITLEQSIAEEDQSGQSSTTTASEQGQKAKQLNITGLIEYSNEKTLTRLFELASQESENGNKKIYRVANSLAQAVKLREGVFAGKISATPDSELLAWNISFSIKERMSVPEKKQSSQKNAVNNSSETPSFDDAEIFRNDESTSNDKEHELSSFEQLLQKVDNNLA